MTTIDVIAHNAQAWDNHVKNASQWTVPVSHEEIEAARAGLFSILLTAKKTVTRDWFPQNLAGLKILCLACGGGQQAPFPGPQDEQQQRAGAHRRGDEQQQQDEFHARERV